ncbi:MAG: glycosyltransferase [Aquimonas sp.]|nr:glycosyltransferase [Aquimonas sp.]
MRAESVLVVSDEMEVGGSQRQIVHLLRGLKRRGRRPALLYFRRPSFLVEQVVAEDVPVARIDKRGAIDLRFLRALRRFLREGRFDVVHCFSITAEMWVRLTLIGLPGTRLVSSVRGLSTTLPGWQWRAKRWVLRGSAAVISNSRAGADYVARRCGLDPAGIEVVPNGVEFGPLPGTAQRAAVREALGLDARPLLLFVGRLVPEKNLPLLLQALARLPAAQRPLAWLAGEGPERPTLLQQCAELGLQDDIVLLGERDDTGALMAAADLLVLPSREEGLSNVLLEAMAAGLPVLASDAGGSPELVEDGVCGLLFRSGDLDALVAALRRLLEDPALRRLMGAEGRARVEREYAVERMVERSLAIYDRCLQPVAIGLQPGGAGR